MPTTNRVRRWRIQKGRWFIRLQRETWTDGGFWSVPSWHPGQYYTVRVDSHWKAGREHMWYDGGHCALHLGFIHIYWQNNNCHLCAEDGAS